MNPVRSISDNPRPFLQLDEHGRLLTVCSKCGEPKALAMPVVILDVTADGVVVLHQSDGPSTEVKA